MSGEVPEEAKTEKGTRDRLAPVQSEDGASAQPRFLRSLKLGSPNIMWQGEYRAHGYLEWFRDLARVSPDTAGAGRGSVDEGSTRLGRESSPFGTRLSNARS